MSVEQATQMAHVMGRVAKLVMAFARRKKRPYDFNAKDLQVYCEERTGEHHIAPGTADRVLRQLRKDGRLNYVVLDRTKSLYRMLSVESD